MIVLGIETSCDETAVAVVADGRNVLCTVISSSMGEQAAFGGVFPELAARRQTECIVQVIDGALEQAGMRPERIDAIAVTKGPGLLTSLLVGVTAARVLASVWRKPLIGVHHTLGHLSSPWLLERQSRVRRSDFQYVNILKVGRRWVWKREKEQRPGRLSEEPKFPVLALSVSGGHTELWLRESHTRGTMLGSTRDDAAGEAFDKGAALLGLPYPGGPALSTLAEGGNPRYAEFGIRNSEFGKSGMDFSFSGLKTALKYFLRDRGGLEAFTEAEKKDIAASYQEAICSHLVSRVERALASHPAVCEVHLVGGVAANQRLRIILRERVSDFVFRISDFAYCTDNAAMIAAAGYFMVQETGNAAFSAFETEATIASESR